MKNLVKSIAVVALIVTSSTGGFAAKNASDSSEVNGFQVVCGFALLICAIVLPALKSEKVR